MGLQNFMKKLIKEKHYLSEYTFDTGKTWLVLEALDYIIMWNGEGRLSAILKAPKKRAAFLCVSMVKATSR